MAEIKTGIYHIIVTGSVNSARLTRHGRDLVTVLPPGAAPEPEQEWEVSDGKDGQIIISVPSRFRPGSYLSWRGEPEKPERGQQIVYHISEIPVYKWHVEPVHDSHFSLHADGSELGIKIAPPDIYPPFLELTREDQFHWIFEYVRPKEE